jgi:hypothetical protein
MTKPRIQRTATIDVAALEFTAGGAGPKIIEKGKSS